MTVLTVRVYEQDNVQHLYVLQDVPSCSYCDTVYSLFGEETPCEYTEMTVDEIISKVNMTYKRVTLTGGEPLVHTDSAELVSKLTELGCDVNIETNGAVDIVDFLGKVQKSDNLFLQSTTNFRQAV